MQKHIRKIAITKRWAGNEWQLVRFDKKSGEWVHWQEFDEGIFDKYFGSAKEGMQTFSLTIEKVIEFYANVRLDWNEYFRRWFLHDAKTGALIKDLRHCDKIRKIFPLAEWGESNFYRIKSTAK